MAKEMQAKQAHINIKPARNQPNMSHGPSHPTKHQEENGFLSLCLPASKRELTSLIVAYIVHLLQRELNGAENAVQLTEDSKQTARAEENTHGQHSSCL
jgi:hypothetical protein